ncbi:ATP synthase subunit I, partial [Thermodesulfobacteriota bacterium]
VIELSSFKKTNAVALLILVILSYIFLDIEFTRGVFLGGLLVVANIFFIDMLLKKGIQREDGSREFKLKAPFIAGMVIKSGVLFSIVFVLLYYYKIHGIGFFVGISVLFISLLIDLIFK